MSLGSPEFNNEMHVIRKSPHYYNFYQYEATKQRYKDTMKEMGGRCERGNERERERERERDGKSAKQVKIWSARVRAAAPVCR